MYAYPITCKQGHREEDFLGFRKEHLTHSYRSISLSLVHVFSASLAEVWQVFKNLLLVVKNYIYIAIY